MLCLSISSSQASVGLRTPVLLPTRAKVAFSDHREDGERLKKTLCRRKVLHCFFFADCQMLREDLKNQTVPQACVTPPSVGRQTRCGPGNNRVAAKRENMPAGGRQHRACCSNLPPSFASPAWKLSRPGAIWSSLR